MSPLFLELTLRYFCYFLFPLPPYLYSPPHSLTSKLKTMEYNKAQVLCPSITHLKGFLPSFLSPSPPTPPLFLPQPHLHYRVSSLHPSITYDCTCQVRVSPNMEYRLHGTVSVPTLLFSLPLPNGYRLSISQFQTLESKNLIGPVWINCYFSAPILFPMALLSPPPHVPPTQLNLLNPIYRVALSLQRKYRR